MRIGIDARLYGERGLGRYISQLLLHLEAVDHENEYVVFLRQAGFDAYMPRVKNFTKVLADVSWYGVREQIVFPRILVSQRLDLVHFPHFNVPAFYRGKFVVTIHDFILYDFPTTRATTRSALTFLAKYAAYRFIFWSAIQRAQHILTPSLYVRNRLLYHYPSVGESKVTVTREGSFGEESSRREKNRLGEYVLAVGSAYPHKNLEALINAFLMLRRKDTKLLIVGKKDYFMRRLENNTKSNFVTFVEGVGDSALVELYAQAKAVAVVSCEEGFGLPGIEALRFGTPVIASDRSSLPEVYRDRVYYVNPYDVEDITRVFNQVLNISYEVRPRKSEEDSWQSLAEITKAVYENIDI